jgi:sodium/bile acid cotransporter 7
VALGIPILNIIYGELPELGILTVPLLIYHAVQLVIGSIIVNWFRKKWIKIVPEEVEL